MFIDWDPTQIVRWKKGNSLFPCKSMINILEACDDRASLDRYEKKQMGIIGQYLGRFRWCSEQLRQRHPTGTSGTIGAAPQWTMGNKTAIAFLVASLGHFDSRTCFFSRQGNFDCIDLHTQCNKLNY